MTDEEFMQGYDILFSAPLRLAHEALLTYAAEMSEDAWPTVQMIVRFAKCYSCSESELAALCGILSYLLGNRTVFCDSRRAPAHVRITEAKKFSRKTVAAFGYYVTAATLSARDNARVN